MPLKIDWHYHRPNCITCKRALEFLDRKKAEIGEQVNAAKIKYGPSEALKIARSAKQLFIAKGKKLVHFDLQKTRPDDEELLKHLLGPSGNLRAPAIRRGDRLFIGFQPDEFAAQLAK